jgi:hypothetical protein
MSLDIYGTATADVIYDLVTRATGILGLIVWIRLIIT